MRPRTPLRAAAGVSAALLSMLVAEGLRARRAEYLPDPAHRVDLMVGDHPAEPVRLAVLGDSTAAGIGAETADRTLAGLIAERLADALHRPVRATGYGVSGARTADVAAQARRCVLAHPDVVLVVIGSNDATHALPPWRMRPDTARMLGTVRRVAGGVPVLLGGIPEFKTVPAIRQPLRAVLGGYAALLRRSQRRGAADADVVFVDIAAEASPRFLGRPESMSPDGFHPSEVGYGLWADALAPALAQLLRRR